MKLEYLTLIPALLGCIKLIDNSLDPEPLLQNRLQIAQDATASLTNSNTDPVLSDPSSLQVRQRFLQIPKDQLQPALETLFTDTEKLRATKNPTEYAQLTAQDGINTAVILLLFLDLNPDQKLYKITHDLTVGVFCRMQTSFAQYLFYPDPRYKL